MYTTHMPRKWIRWRRHGVAPLPRFRSACTEDNMIRFFFVAQSSQAKVPESFWHYLLHSMSQRINQRKKGYAETDTGFHSVARKWVRMKFIWGGKTVEKMWIANFFFRCLSRCLFELVYVCVRACVCVCLCVCKVPFVPEPIFSLPFFQFFFSFSFDKYNKSWTKKINLIYWE